MKVRRVFVSILCVLFIVGVVFAQDYDVRKVRWGMTETEVIRAEGENPVYRNEEVDAIIYSADVGGEAAIIAYQFYQGKLWKCKILFKEKYLNKNNYISKYDEILEILINKYGQPKFNEKIWHNDYYKDDYEYWGEALSLGHLTCGALWQNENTELCIYLNGEDDGINFSVEYYSAELMEKAMEEQEAAKADEF